MTYVTCGLTAKKPESAPCPTLETEYRLLYLFKILFIINSLFTPILNRCPAVRTGDFDGGCAVDFSSHVLRHTLIDALVHVDRVLDVQCPVVESLTHGLNAMRSGDNSPVFPELDPRVRRTKHSTLQLAVLMKVKHLVFQRLQERWWIYTEY